MQVAIVGGAPGSIDLAPYDDPEWEIWVHGNQMEMHQGRRVTRIFEVHDDLTGMPEGYAEWLVSLGVPVVSGECFPVPAEVFPFDDAKALMGDHHLTSTSSYMMAYAILKGATHIAIYGIDMGIDDAEYFYQRPTMYAWIGYAKAKGITVTIPDASPLFRDDKIYGRDEVSSLAPFSSRDFAELAAMHQQHMDNIKGHIATLEMKLQTHDGCRQAYERLTKVARAVESGQTIPRLLDTSRIK